MIKFIYATCLLMLTIVFTACPNKYEEQHVFVKDMSDDVRATIPYQHGDVVHFLHENNRTIIDFTASRQLSNKTESVGFYPGIKIIHYQCDIVKLRPNYPIFDIELILNNFEQFFDEEYEITPVIGIGNKGFRINNNCIIEDTLVINDKEYYNVMKAYANHDDSPATSFDTILYNYEYGILQIKMTTGETYTYIDEE